MSADRTVHATGTDRHGDRYEIARYDRAGKWRIEFLGGYSRPITLAEAVEFADEALLGQPGGKTFDARYRRKTAEFAAHLTTADQADGPPCAREVWLSGGPLLPRCDLHEPAPCPIPPDLTPAHPGGDQ